MNFVFAITTHGFSNVILLTTAENTMTVETIVWKNGAVMESVGKQMRDVHSYLH